jgi:hypothetical protein
MNIIKSSLWSLRMNLQRLALLGCQFAVDTNGTPVPGIVLLESYIGSSELNSEQRAPRRTRRSGLWRLSGVSESLNWRTTPSASAFQAPCLVHAARTTPPDVIEPFFAEFDASLRRVFAESICSLTDAGWSKIQLPFREQGGGFAELGSILRPAHTARIIDTAPARAGLRHDPDTASLIEPFLPPFRDNFTSYGLSDESDVHV